MTSVMRPDPRYELALASQVPHTQTEHPDTSAEAVTVVQKYCRKVQPSEQGARTLQTDRQTTDGWLTLRCKTKAI